ncbi:alkaline phosphatase family protein [Microbacterium sp. C7(2022)]|uniref:alkaline phosphatase family protein n=1 Tax=Microbacterium sp. C7(2022) TaxID=2992759 RepID=UPI00237BD42D|nr:nucleotide pyrophosphatase/phosphodiesterase family protein [Microbacterium sp. C7(2022)]MDE0545469.1 alkaline phosphatase family protein [Microbacterium sp. C7(2022)]
MSLSLPAESAHARSLTDVVPQMLRALSSESDWLPPARSAIVFVIDGLGASNLSARAGHARFLSSMSSKKSIGRTVFPSTTASALTSLLTGTHPGTHGIVGYRARVPGTDRVVNQLRGWEQGGLPEGWQRATPLAERTDGPFFVVSKKEYAGTGFTRATQEGAEFTGVDDLLERVRIAAHLAHRHPGSLTYLYAPELDGVGHQRGWESGEWVAALESMDAAAAALAAELAPDVGALVTADHGMVDVPRHRHVLLGEGHPLLDGVRLIGGEPRTLHLYAEPGRAHEVAARWKDSESGRAWVLTRAELRETGLLGDVHPDVNDRVGDVVVAARTSIAYYDDRLSDKGPQRMIGQHGSLTHEERTVPLIRLGAFRNV